MAAWTHIVGGGLSGLTLAAALARHERLPGPVVVSEPRAELANDRTFSFWFREQERALLAPEYETAEWSISTATSETLMRGRLLKYGVRTARSVYEAALRAIDRHPQISLRQERLAHKPDARHVFDSRPPAVDTFRLCQSFAGVEIELARPHQMTEVRLMHRITATDSGIRFLYVVPLGPRRALIEHTEFTTRPAEFARLERQNLAWIREHYGQDYACLREERAHIPMGLNGPQCAWGLPIGARGGMTRAATGYGYATISRWCRAAARALVERDRCRPFATAPVFRRMDALFLGLLERRPDVMPGVLFKLAKNMSGDAFADFMMQTRLRDAARVIFAAPMKPFALALFGKYRWI